MAFVLLHVSLLAAALLSIPYFLGDFAAYQFGLYLIYGMAAQGIGFLWGKTGVLPLGQAMFFGVAAYAMGIALRDVDGLLVQLALGVAILLVIAGFAYILATLVFKGRSDSGPYFSLITLALAMIAEQLSGSFPNITGGFNGLSGFDSLAGLDPFGSFYYVIVAASVGVTFMLLVLDRLPISLIAKAVNDNEPRMQLLGFPTHVIKGLAFAFSAAIAAIAGGLFASHQGIVTPTSTGFALSAELVILTAVGGRFHVFGPLLGAVFFGWAASEFRDSFAYWELLLAVVFIVVVLKAPGGLAELLKSAFNKILPHRTKANITTYTAPPARYARTSESLKFDDVYLQIGVVKILNGVDFETPKSGIVSIIGPNGAGKTTILNTITGNFSVSKGKIQLGTQEIQSRPSYGALSVGIGRKLQIPSVFFSMSVAENLSIAMMAGRARTLDYFKLSTLGWRGDGLTKILANPTVPLANNIEKAVQFLPQGHRQFLEFAMTVATDPSTLLLDEPCAGLSPQETMLMTELVKEFQDTTDGLVIIIEHDMSIVEAISDKVLVLHQGRVLAYASYREIKSDPAVQAVYAGDTK